MFALRRKCSVAVASRAFATTAPRLAVSPFAVFLKVTGKNKGMKKIGGPARAKLLSLMWKTLPAGQKAAIRAQAKKTKFTKNRRAVAHKKMRAAVAARRNPKITKALKKNPTKYVKFTKNALKQANIQAIPSTQARLKAVAKLWKAAKRK